jgi:DNA polymerase delta subunit 1
MKTIMCFDWITYPSSGKRIRYEDVTVLRDDDNPLLPTHSQPPLALYLDIEILSKDDFINSESKKANYPIGVISVATSTGQKRSFMLGRPIPGGGDHIYTFSREDDLLQAFQNYFMEIDPDIISGYNINKFDIPYLITRAKQLGLERFPYWSRIRDVPLTMHETQRTTNQAGTQTQVFIDCPGRISYDLYPLIRKTYKFDNFKLGTVLKAFDLDPKVDVGYEDIYPYFHGTDEQRAKLEQYCLRDSQCIVELEKKTDAIRRLMAKCKVLRLRARDALDRGLGYVLSMMICSKYRPLGYLNKKKKTEYNQDLGRNVNILDAAFEDVVGYEELWDMKERHEKYPGAFVFEPIRGFYKEAILTLDFNSLYPSIIQTMNICRSTQLQNKDLDPDANVSPCGFAYSKKKEGVFPMIERELVSARKGVKRKMENETDVDKRAMYDAEQNELKVAANSLYGLLGTTTSDVSLLSGAYSVTAWGAYFIRRVCDTLHQLFGTELQVIYGDTDSLFIRLIGVTDMSIAREKAVFYENFVNAELKRWMRDECHIEKKDVYLLHSNEIHDVG